MPGTQQGPGTHVSDHMRDLVLDMKILRVERSDECQETVTANRLEVVWCEDDQHQVPTGSNSESQRTGTVATQPLVFQSVRKGGNGFQPPRVKIQRLT